MKSSTLWVPSFACVVVACSSSSTNGAGTSASVSGTVAGVTLNVASTFVGLSSSSSSTSGTCSADGDACVPGTSTYTNGIAVVFTNRADVTCSEFQGIAASGTETAFANLQEFVVEVNVVNGDVKAGTYPLTSAEANAPGAGGVLTTNGASCAQTAYVQATAGTVTISQIDGSHVAGTYSLTFGTHGTFTGAFDQPICAIDAGGAPSGKPPVCVN